MNYDVQIKAVKPNKVVTVAQFEDQDGARECAAGLTALGFQTIVSSKETKPSGWYFAAPYDR